MKASTSEHGGGGREVGQRERDKQIRPECGVRFGVDPRTLNQNQELDAQPAEPPRRPYFPVLYLPLYSTSHPD